MLLVCVEGKWWIMIDLLSSQIFPPPKFYAIATVICSALCGFVGTHALVHFQGEDIFL